MRETELSFKLFYFSMKFSYFQQRNYSSKFLNIILSFPVAEIVVVVIVGLSLFVLSFLSPFSDLSTFSLSHLKRRRRKKTRIPREKDVQIDGRDRGLKSFFHSKRKGAN